VLAIETWAVTLSDLLTHSRVIYIGLYIYIYIYMGRDGVVGIATRYGLDGPGIESRWGARFSAPVQTDTRAHPASCTMCTASVPWGKAAGAWRCPPPSSAEVKERVELLLYPSSGSSWPVLGWTLYIYIFIYIYIYVSVRIINVFVRWHRTCFFKALPDRSQDVYSVI
jgi:hypothetical protein